MNQDNFSVLEIWAANICAEYAVGYDLDGICTLEESLFSNNIASKQLNEKDQIIQIYKIGAFIGTCLIANLEGTWSKIGDGIGIQLTKQGIWVDPFLAVERFLKQNQSSDALSRFYQHAAHFEMT